MFVCSKETISFCVLKMEWEKMRGVVLGIGKETSEQGLEKNNISSVILCCDDCIGTVGSSCEKKGTCGNRFRII